MKLSAVELERWAALHEAGHAVAGCLLRVQFDHVEILPFKDFRPLTSGRRMGFARLNHTIEPVELSDDGGVFRPTHDTLKVIDALIMFALAGWAAEEVVLRGHYGDSDEQDMADLHAELNNVDTRVRESYRGQVIDWPWLPRGPERDAHVEQMRKEAVILMARHRPILSAVQLGLLQRRSLSRSEVAAIVDRFFPPPP